MRKGEKEGEREGGPPCGMKQSRKRKTPPPRLFNQLALDLLSKIKHISSQQLLERANESPRYILELSLRL
jgi:hypothetical protein